MGSAFEAKRAEVFNRFARVIVEKLNEAKSACQIGEVDVELASRVWLGALNEVVVHWLFSDGPSPRDSAQELKKLLVSSLMSASTLSEGEIDS